MPIMSEPADGLGPYKTFVCVVCGFIYDEAAGWPSEGIQAGTRWSAVPDWWTCPDCGVGKADFDMVEVA
jgi:rubredoxin